MTEYLSVTPGIDMTRDLGETRLTKTWLKKYLAAHPEKDFRNHSGRGAYVNGEDCIRYDLCLEVRRAGTFDLVAAVEFKKSDANPWGYVAVIR